MTYNKLKLMMKTYILYILYIQYVCILYNVCTIYYEYMHILVTRSWQTNKIQFRLEIEEQKFSRSTPVTVTQKILCINPGKSSRDEMMSRDKV